MNAPKTPPNAARGGAPVGFLSELPEVEAAAVFFCGCGAKAPKPKPERLPI